METSGEQQDDHPPPPQIKSDQESEQELIRQLRKEKEDLHVFVEKLKEQIKRQAERIDFLEGELWRQVDSPTKMTDSLEENGEESCSPGKPSGPSTKADEDDGSETEDDDDFPHSSESKKRKEIFPLEEHPKKRIKFDRSSENEELTSSQRRAGKKEVGEEEEEEREDNKKKLVEIGFSGEEAEFALSEEKGNFSSALDFLLRDRESEKSLHAPFFSMGFDPLNISRALREGLNFQHTLDLLLLWRDGAEYELS